MPSAARLASTTAAAGIRYVGRTDVLLALLDQGTTVAGVLTRSKCPSAPVDWCRVHLKGGEAAALVVNSGNANAFTGKSGREATKLTARLAGEAAGCAPRQVFLASTGPGDGGYELQIVNSNPPVTGNDLPPPAAVAASSGANSASTAGRCVRNNQIAASALAEVNIAWTSPASRSLSAGPPPR